MERFMTAYCVDWEDTAPNGIRCFTAESCHGVQDDAEEFVWQFAPNAETAIEQHLDKMNDWHTNPNKETY